MTLQRSPFDQQDYKDNTHDLQTDTNHRIFKSSLSIFFFLFSLVLSFWIGFERGTVHTKDGSVYSLIPFTHATIIDKEQAKVDFSLFWETWNLLKEKYVDRDNLKEDVLLYGAIDGMLRATGDPYTTFFDPDENKDFGEDISGTFQGIGAEMGIQDNILTVIAPLDDSPAQKAGIRAGDKVLKINGENSVDLSIEQAVEKIRGMKDTEVTLTIFRNNGTDTTQDIVVKRGVIVVHSVRSEFSDSGIGYIKIIRFGDNTTTDFANALNDIVQKKPKGLIIDVRNNPGGYLHSAVDISSMLLPKGNVVVIEEDGLGKKKKIFTREGDRASQIETVILLNQGSASASEILAGALRDNRDNITIVGVKSYGKGSVQEFIDLPRKTAVKITVAKWRTPNGDQINNVGIVPDKIVDFTKEDYENKSDPQRDEAIKILMKKIDNL